MVEVVFHEIAMQHTVVRVGIGGEGTKGGAIGEVLFGKVGNICMLDMWNVTGMEKSDIHRRLVCLWRKLCRMLQEALKR